jgi:SpoVK/Ycf46/Vps4 family AAA+-type ATPase
MDTYFLLQRIEDFDGLIILATNLKPNIDRAFIRRFQSIIHFTLPLPKERELLWRKALSSFNVSSKIDYTDIAKRFEVSGGAINNAVQFSWLTAKRYGEDVIHPENIIHGIMRELGKEGKISIS